MAWWQDDLENQRLGNYRIEEKLGEGGMAEVFRAVGVEGDLRGRTVAIKVPRIGAIPPDELHHYLRRFEHEIKLQNAEPIAHVVRMLGAGEAVDRRGVRRPYLVMDYLAGGSLGKKLGGTIGARTQPQSLTEVLAWLRPIAEALDDLHASTPPRLHRDVKPENLLFNGQGKPFLADFGIATTLTALGSSLGPSGTGMPSPGSGGYRAPETLAGARQAKNPASDQFSLAATVYEALSGRLPVNVTSTEEYWGALMNWQPIHLYERCPELPRAATDAVMRALSRNPADRFPSCSEFARALVDGARAPSSAKQAAMAPRPTPPPPSPVSKKGSQRWLWLAAAAIIALAVVAYLVWPSPDASPAAVATTQPAQPFTPPPEPVQVEESKPAPAEPPPPATGVLALEVTPPQAEVLVNGALIGAGIRAMPDLPSGIVEVRARHPGYDEQSIHVHIIAGQSNLARLQLKPTPPATGTLALDIQPADAQVQVNGRLLTADERQRQELELPPGEVEIRASLAGHVEKADRFQVVTGERRPARVHLERAPPPVVNGRLTVVPTPGNARVRVLNIGPTYQPGMELPPGRYDLEVSADGYETKREWVNLGSGELRHSVQLSAMPPPAPPPAAVQSVPVSAPVAQTADPRNGGFVLHGDGLLLDTQTGLLWTQSDNGSNINWTDANSYCQGKGMRLPSMTELEGIYDRPGSGTTPCGVFDCKVSPLFRITSWWFWSGDRVGSSEARRFTLDDGPRISYPVSHSDNARALCVRRGS